MKRPRFQWPFFALLVATCCIVSSCQTPPPVSPETPAMPAMPLLRAQGHDIVNADGDVVVLRGCNIGSWLLIEPWMMRFPEAEGVNSEQEIWDTVKRRFGEEAMLDLMKLHRDTFFTEADVKRIAELGLNSIRVPVWWRAVSDPAYGGDIDYLDRCIAWCKKYGLYVVIDLHGAPGRQSVKGVITGEPGGADLWKDEQYKDRTVAWWTDIAQRYRDESTVAGYDLLNEAVDAPFEDLVALYDRLYHAIREVDPNHILIIEDGLQGFHRLPRPVDMGWENVVYSFHYYPQSPEEGLAAAGTILHRYYRSQVHYGVPLYVGEFSPMTLDRGGIDSLLRYTEVFNYYGWSWHFWTYKKIEDDYDAIWGIYGYYDEDPAPDVRYDSQARIRTGLEAMRTDASLQHPLMAAALQAPQRLVDAPWQGVAPVDAILLPLDEAIVVPSADDAPLKIEWQRNIPNVGYWRKGDRVLWRVTVEKAGVYDLVLVAANYNDGNVVRVSVDGVHVSSAEVDNAMGWGNYMEQRAGRLALSEGTHMISLEQGDAHGDFLNVRYGWLQTAGQPIDDESAAEEIILDGFNVGPVDEASRVRVDWTLAQPHIGYWRSGETLQWSVDIAEAAQYGMRITYATPNADNRIRIMVDDAVVVNRELPQTGAWNVFERHEVAVQTLTAGPHVIKATWQTESGIDPGNLRSVSLGSVTE